MVDSKRVQEVEDAKRRSGMSKLIGPFGGFRGPLYNEHLSKNIFFRMFVNLSDLTVWINYFTIIAAALQSKSVVEFALSGFPISGMTRTLFLTYYAGYKNDEFTDILLRFDDCFDNDPYPEHLEFENERMAKYYHSFPRSLLMIQVVTMQIYCFIFPMTNELLHDYFRPRALPLPSVYPCDWKESQACFLMILFVYFFGAWFVNWKIIAFGELFFAIVSRQVALFRHLNHNLNKLLNTIQVSKDGEIQYTVDKETDHKYIKKALKDWIKHHQAVMAQYERVHALNSWPLFVHFGLISGVLCCTAYAASDETLDFDANFLCGGFLIGQTFELYYLCRMGDWITIETDELSWALTGVNTFILDKEESQMLSIILCRVNRPCVMRALGIYPLNTDTLKVLMQSTYSYYTMLKNAN